MGGKWGIGLGTAGLTTTISSYFGPSLADWASAITPPQPPRIAIAVGQVNGYAVLRLSVYD